MFTTPAEEARRFDTEVADFLGSAVEQASSIRRFVLFLLLLGGLLLRLGHTLDASSFGFNVSSNRRKITFFELDDFHGITLWKRSLECVEGHERYLVPEDTP